MHHLKPQLISGAFLFCLLALGLGGCGGGNGSSALGPIPLPTTQPVPTATPQRISGIRGNVVHVLIPGVEPQPPIPRPTPVVRPLADAMITVRIPDASGGREIARQRTDASGVFQILLPPGTYLIVPLPPPDSGGTFGNNQFVTVRPGAFTDLTIRYITPLP